MFRNIGALFVGLAWFFLFTNAPGGGSVAYSLGIRTSPMRIFGGMSSKTFRFPMKLNSALVELKSGEGEFNNEIIAASNKMPVVVDFMANWCGPCKLVAPIFKALADDFEGKVKFVKVDTDIHEDTVDTYNIQGLPLFAIFVDGKIVAQHSGALTRDNMRSFIEKNVKVTA